MCCDATGHALTATNKEEAKFDSGQIFLYLSQVRKQASAALAAKQTAQCTLNTGMTQYDYKPTTRGLQPVM